MMKWYDALWIGPKAEKKRRKLIDAVKNGKKMLGAYVIALSSNPCELLDIIPVSMIGNPGCPADNLYIIGIADGKAEAFSLVEKIVDYIYRETGKLDIREYFTESCFSV